MTILLTGATGYIGQRLLPLLAAAGHDLVCLVRDPRRFALPELLPAGYHGQVRVVAGDLLKPESLADLPLDIDVAYYLVHSMSGHDKDFFRLEQQSAQHFRNYLDRTTARQVIYLSGIANDRALSVHLRSRRAVEKALCKAEKAAVTVLRASIIIGSGSASFEIIRVCLAVRRRAHSTFAERRRRARRRRTDERQQEKRQCAYFFLAAFLTVFLTAAFFAGFFFAAAFLALAMGYLLVADQCDQRVEPEEAFLG